MARSAELGRRPFGSFQRGGDERDAVVCDQGVPNRRRPTLGRRAGPCGLRHELASAGARTLCQRVHLEVDAASSESRDAERVDTPMAEDKFGRVPDGTGTPPP